MDAGTILLAAGVVAVLWVLFSKDRLASAIRARFTSVKEQAADAATSVDAETTAAKVAQQKKVEFGRTSLYQLQLLAATAQTEVETSATKVEKLNRAMQIAHDKGDKPGFMALVEQFNAATTLHDGQAQAYAAVMAKVQELEVGVDEQRAKEQMLQNSALVMKSQARVSVVTTAYDEAAAQLSGPDTADAHMKAAEDKLAALNSRARAAATAKAGLTPGERAAKSAQVYLDAVNRGSADVDANDLWAKMDSPAATPSTPA